jgi:hypothetical protein
MGTESISVPFQEEVSNDEIRNHAAEGMPTADDVSQLSTNIPMGTMPSQEGADSIRSYAQVLLTQPVLQEGDSTRSQEGASTRSQEGGTSTGPTTRSQSRNSSTSLNSTPIPQVITSVSTLRQSSRLHGKPKVTYDTDVPPTRDTSSFRLLIKARRINGKAVTNVAIGLSYMPNADYGLIALKNIKESTRICSYGKLYASNPIYPRVYDTVFSDVNGMAIGDRDRDYGAWCNDPLDNNKVNCVIEYDAEHKLYVVRARWDIQENEELFVDYGEEYWRESYWSNSTAVNIRHPGITPNNLAPEEGEDSEDFDTVELPDGAPDNLPKDIFEAKTKNGSRTYRRRSESRPLGWLRSYRRYSQEIRYQRRPEKTKKLIAKKISTKE